MNRSFRAKMSDPFAHTLSPSQRHRSRLCFFSITPGARALAVRGPERPGPFGRLCRALGKRPRRGSIRDPGWSLIPSAISLARTRSTDVHWRVMASDRGYPRPPAYGHRRPAGTSPSLASLESTCSLLPERGNQCGGQRSGPHLSSENHARPRYRSSSWNVPGLGRARPLSARASARG
jgi:hypothetical protein